MTAPDIDLTDAIDTLRGLMIDRCIITRDPEATTDDVFDAAQGKYVRPVGDTITLYPVDGGDGACLLAATGTVNGNPGPPSAFPAPTQSYRLTLPLDAPLFRAGDLVTMTACHYDPALVDMTFVVSGLVAASYAVSRQVDMVTARA